MTGITATSQAQLDAAVQQVNAAQSGSDTLTFRNSITEGNAGQPAGRYALDFNAGVTVYGNGDALNGGRIR